MKVNADNEVNAADVEAIYIDWSSEVVMVRLKNRMGYTVDTEQYETLSMALQRMKDLYTKEFLYQFHHVIYPYGRV